MAIFLSPAHFARTVYELNVINVIFKKKNWPHILLESLPNEEISIISNIFSINKDILTLIMVTFDFATLIDTF